VKKLLILSLAFFMALSFSGVVSAQMHGVVTYRTSPVVPGTPASIPPPETSYILAPSEFVTVYMYLEYLPPDQSLTATAFGSFIDYDDSQLELVSYTVANPVPWADSGMLEMESTEDWWTVDGWYNIDEDGDGNPDGYVPPGYFEEGSDLLTVGVSSLTAAPSHLGYFPPPSMPILIATFEFHCIAPGTSYIYAIQRPNGIVGGGSGYDEMYGTYIWDDNTVDWDSSFIEIINTPIPTTVLLLGSGLIGLLGFRRRMK
jgi:hypothetical protein